MPLSELPLSVLFIIFLLLFVLIGIYPAWKKTAARLRRALQAAEASDTVQLLPKQPAQNDFYAVQHAARHLTDFETFVLRRLAQTYPQALSRKQINANLHLETAPLKSALESLLRSGLVSMRVGLLSGIRYQLSPSGHDYATEQGFILSMHSQTD